MSDKNSIVLFKAIFDFFPDPIVVADKTNYKIKTTNIEFQNLYRKSNKFLIKKNLKDILLDCKLLFLNLSEVNKDDGVLIINEKIKINEFEFLLKCIFSRELDEDFLLIFSHVEKNRDSDEFNLDYLSEIFSILSHEVNNPISSIKLAADLLKKKHKNIDNELVEIIKSESTRITRLFSNFTNPDFHNITKKTNENIHQLIRLSLFKIKQLPTKLKIIEEFDPSLPLIRIHRDQILQALDNIFINAYESSDSSLNSYLRIKTRFVVGESIKIPNIKDNIKKNCIRLVVSNNGVGISDDILKKIFLPFFSTKKRGSGVGLFIVNKIINDHDGTIDIQSKDGITSVNIILPF